MSKDWKVPRKCKWPFGHKFQHTKHLVRILGPLLSQLEICQKCGGGRVFGLGSYDYYVPDAVQDFLDHMAPPDAGKVIELFGPRGKDGAPRPER